MGVVGDAMLEIIKRDKSGPLFTVMSLQLSIPTLCWILIRHLKIEDIDEVVD